MLWQIETFDFKKRRWEPLGAATADFHAIWKKSEDLAASGYKARIVKTYVQTFYIDAPEREQPAGETPEDTARRFGCTFSAPFNCEFCDKKSCQVSWYHIGTEEAAE